MTPQDGIPSNREDDTLTIVACALEYDSCGDVGWENDEEEIGSGETAESVGPIKPSEEAATNEEAKADADKEAVADGDARDNADSADRKAAVEATELVTTGGIEADEANVDVVPVIGMEGMGVARRKRATRSTAGTIVRGTTVLVDPDPNDTGPLSSSRWVAQVLSTPINDENLYTVALTLSTTL